MEVATPKKAHILIVDDDPGAVSVLERVLAEGGYESVLSTTDSSQVLGMCARTPPDLIVLDLEMPSPDGFELLELLAPWLEGRWFPVIVTTSDSSPETRRRALEAGAKDFLTKPVESTEALLRIKNLLEVRFLQLELRGQSLTLEQQVDERTRALNDARLEILERLAIASEYRDDDSGEHGQRIGRNSGLLAEAIELPADEVRLIRLAAPLHDIGKIGVPDHILLKPGKLTTTEYEYMKNHVTIGAFILSRSRSPILSMGEQIALTHHEWWDGSGYISGLAGADIPLSGRIVALVDVFDALVNDRPYRPAWPIAGALEEIDRLSGSQFDPRLVDAFMSLDHERLVAPVDSPIQLLPRDLTGYSDLVASRRQFASAQT